MGFLLDLVANLLATWLADLLTPYGMTGLAIAVAVTVAFAIYWHRQSRKAGKLGMASWPFIFACFAIAALAIGGGAYGLGLRFATGENKAVAGTPAVSQGDGGPVDLYTSKKIPPPPLILDHKLNREAANYLLGAIDKLNAFAKQIAQLDFPSGVLPPAFAGHVHSDGIDRLEPDAIDRIREVVPERLKDFQTAFNTVVSIISADDRYKDEVAKIVGSHHLDEINGCISQYMAALDNFKNENLDRPSRKIANMIMQDPIKKCEVARQGFVQWRDALPERLKAARKEVEAFL